MESLNYILILEDIIPTLSILISGAHQAMNGSTDANYLPTTLHDLADLFFPPFMTIPEY